MEKGWLIIVTIVFLVVACTPQKPMIRVEDINCTAMGYVPVRDVNTIINVTNKLVDISNMCTANSNVTPLPYLRSYPTKP